MINLRMVNVNDPNYEVEVMYYEQLKFMVKYNRINEKFYAENGVESMLSRSEMGQIRRLTRDFVNGYIVQL